MEDLGNDDMIVPPVHNCLTKVEHTVTIDPHPIIFASASEVTNERALELATPLTFRNFRYAMLPRVKWTLNKPHSTNSTIRPRSYTSRLCSTAASTNEANKGCG